MHQLADYHAGHTLAALRLAQAGNAEDGRQGKQNRGSISGYPPQLSIDQIGMEKIMEFVIQINCSPYQAQGADTAYHFIVAALENGHEIYRVFFYFDGIYNALRYACPPDDERQVIKRWSDLARDQGIDLVVCISAAQRRGLLSASEAIQAGKVDDDLAKGFRISGLGQLIEAVIESDRLMIFGS